LTSIYQRIFCIAVNYRSHEETGISIPSKPYVFTRPRTALIGYKQPIIIPRVSRAVDYEVELGVIIGSRVKDTNKEYYEGNGTVVIVL